MTRYLFEDNPTEREWNRMRLIERALDGESFALLGHAGIGAGSTCLEVGAGAGSIVEWMAERVGPSGHVLAVDKKTVHLQRFNNPPVRVLEGNLTDLTLDRPVDVAHARYVLIHNANDRALLEMIRSAVHPGGMVVLEEPDFTSAAYLQLDQDEAIRRVNHAICKKFMDSGLDPAYGLRLPQRMRDAGFDVQRVESRLHVCEGGAPIADLMAESVLILRETYTQTGLATDVDIDHYAARARDPGRWAVFYATVSVLARAA